MEPSEARRVLGVGPSTTWPDIRRAYRDRIRDHHPDRAGSAGLDEAVAVIEAFRVLDSARRSPATGRVRRAAGAGRGGAPRPGAGASVAGEADNVGRARRSDHGYTEPGPAESPGSPWSIPIDPGGPPPFERVDSDTIRVAAPADETFRWLLEAAHHIGEITYLDRSGPLFEVLCRFVGEPATSLLVTIQGRADGTDALCSAESIEARAGPPTPAVVDVFEQALRSLAATR